MVSLYYYYGIVYAILTLNIVVHNGVIHLDSNTTAVRIAYTHLY